MMILAYGRFGLLEMPDLAYCICLIFGFLMIFSDGVGNFCKVTGSLRRNYNGFDVDVFSLGLERLESNTIPVLSDNASIIP